MTPKQIYERIRVNYRDAFQDFNDKNVLYQSSVAGGNVKVLLMFLIPF